MTSKGSANLNCIQRITAYRSFFIIALSIIVLDQWTKAWVLESITPGAYFPPYSIEVIPGFLYWVHLYNKGAAWGVFSEYTEVLAIIAAGTLLVIYFLRKSFQLKRPCMQWIFGLLVGGITGNLIDRMRLGHVVDFIDVHLPGYRWPAFNVADCAISIGVLSFMFYSFFIEGKKKN